MVDGGTGQHHRVVVGPFGCVAPALLVAVPEVASCRVTYDSLWKTLPDGEGKIHLTHRYKRSHTHATSYASTTSTEVEVLRDKVYLNRTILSVLLVFILK